MRYVVTDLTTPGRRYQRTFWTRRAARRFARDLRIEIASVGLAPLVRLTKR